MSYQRVTFRSLGEVWIRAFKTQFPPLSEQKAIAHILGTLDDKIELNRRMNETLEATARAIFKSWFVDFDPVRAKMDGRQPVGMDADTVKLFSSSFEESELGPIPRGWRVRTLQELTLVIGSGATPRGGSKVYVDEGIALVRSQNVYDFEFRWDGLAHITSEAAEALVPQIAIVSPPKPRLPHLRSGLPSFPSRLWGVLPFRRSAGDRCRSSGMVWRTCG